MLLSKIRANSIHGFRLIIFYLFLTLLDLVKVSNPSGGVLTSSALNTLWWSQATFELIVMFFKLPLPLCSPVFVRDGLTKPGLLLSNHVACKGSKLQ